MSDKGGCFLNYFKHIITGVHKSAPQWIAQLLVLIGIEQSSCDSCSVTSGDQFKCVLCVVLALFSEQCSLLSLPVSSYPQTWPQTHVCACAVLMLCCCLRISPVNLCGSVSGRALVLYRRSSALCIGLMEMPAVRGFTIPSTNQTNRSLSFSLPGQLSQFTLLQLGKHRWNVSKRTVW